MEQKAGVPDRAEQRRFITIGEFVKMMGRRSRNWYYNHLHDEGFPQRIYLPGNDKPVLDLDECIAYQQRATKTPPGKPGRR